MSRKEGEQKHEEYDGLQIEKQNIVKKKQRCKKSEGRECIINLRNKTLPTISG